MQNVFFFNYTFFFTTFIYFAWEVGTPTLLTDPHSVAQGGGKAEKLDVRRKTSKRRSHKFSGCQGYATFTLPVCEDISQLEMDGIGSFDVRYVVFTNTRLNVYSAPLF